MDNEKVPTSETIVKEKLGSSEGRLKASLEELKDFHSKQYEHRETQAEG